MSDFKLSAQLSGHDSDVRAVCFPSSDAVITASRDTTVRIWRKTAAKPPTFDATITTKGQDFINTLAYIPPNSDYSDGLIVSGGKETIIEVKKPNSTPDDNAERLLIGHGHNICALDVSPKATFLVSGSWDSSAIVWRIGKWEPEIRLEGHSGSVWGVLALDEKTVVTGCADEKLRIFDLPSASGGVAQPRSTIHTTDVVRAICAVPKSHPSGADVASAHNDGIIRLWTLQGESKGELHGHESFVYCLTTLPTGELVSSGEDRTVRIWKGTECVQTITHPAISVWSVAASKETGDIATGASDGVARVFTRSGERLADADTLKHFEESVKSSSIPQQQVGGGVNKEKLPGPEFLTSRSGTKDGQVQMIKESNGSVTAHTWSQSQQQWINVGTVVDAVGSSGKKVEYQGQEYDYVFDVDIEDGAPALKLPYNLSQNPYEAATKWLGDHELPLTYLDNVANFIVENTKGATLGQPTGSQSTDFGVGKYQPGDADANTSARILPQREYLMLPAAKIDPVLKKIMSVNATMVSAGRKDQSLNPSDQATLQEVGTSLATFIAQVPSTISASGTVAVPTLQASDAAVNLVNKLVTQWPYNERLAPLDLLRCMVADARIATIDWGRGSSAINVALQSAFNVPDGGALNENMAMMAFRVVVNTFATAKGRSIAKTSMETVVQHIEKLFGTGSAPGNRNLLLAISTTAINYAVLNAFTGDLRDRLCLATVHLLEDPAKTDQEVIYRALVAIGTMAARGGESAHVVKVLGLAAKIKAIGDSKAAEPRIKALVKECLVLLD